MSEINDLIEGAIRDFKEAKQKLTAAQRKLEEYAEETEAKTVSPGVDLHSTIGCVIVDSLEPALRDLGNVSTSGLFPAAIRPATPDDFEAAHGIITATPGLERSDGSVLVPEDLEASLREPNGVFLVAEANGKIVGLIYALLETSTAAVLRYLTVIPEVRRQGIASRLLSECMYALAREWDVKEVGAFVQPETPVVPLLTLNAFRLGAPFVWMSRNIQPLAETDAPRED